MIWTGFIHLKTVMTNFCQKNAIQHMNVFKEYYAVLCTLNYYWLRHLFAKRNYKADVVLGLAGSCIHSSECFFGTGTGLKLLLEDIFEPDRFTSIHIDSSQRLTKAPRDSINVDGTVLLYGLLGESHIHVKFEIVRNFADPDFLGEVYID